MSTKRTIEFSTNGSTTVDGLLVGWIDRRDEDYHVAWDWRPTSDDAPSPMSAKRLKDLKAYVMKHYECTVVPDHAHESDCREAALAAVAAKALAR